MASITIKCPVPDCEYETGEATEAVAVALLNAHVTIHNKAVAAVPTTPPISDRGPKLERPKVDIGISEEEWNMFYRRWELFVRCSDISNDNVTSHLIQCATDTLGDAVSKVRPKITDAPVDECLKLMKSLAVIPVAKGVLRSELLSMSQKRDETFRAFVARVRGKAEICDYTTENTCDCGNNNTVDFTDIILRDILISGIYDTDIRRKILGVTDIINKPINDIVTLVEGEEMARDALPTMATASAVHTSKSPPSTHTTMNRDQKEKCPDCYKLFKMYTEGVRGWNTKPHQVCIDCYRVQRRRRQKRPNTNSANDKTENASIITQCAAIFNESRANHRHRPQTVTYADAAPVGIQSATSYKRKRGRNKNKSAASTRSNRPCDAQPLRMSHHVFTKGEWRRMRFREHPTVNLKLSTNSNDYKSFGLCCPSVPSTEIIATTDTGAQSCLWSLQDCKKAGYDIENIKPVNLDMSAANRSPIKVTGAIFAHLTGKGQSGEPISCATMIYISPSVKGFYLSYEAMIDLGIIAHNFPMVGAAFQPPNTDKYSNQRRDACTLNAMSGCSTGVDNSGRCSCPDRTPVPPRPETMPFTCEPGNNEKMREWLLTHFASSTFNTCPHHPLPSMTGPPVEIHIDTDAVPKVCHTPAPVPLHWQEQVKADLERDEALGVIEKVPYGEQVTWCHRMVITRKHDGTPRRTVDLSPLNKYCKRETFAMESPFQIARRIANNTWKENRHRCMEWIPQRHVTGRRSSPYDVYYTIWSI